MTARDDAITALDVAIEDARVEGAQSRDTEVQALKDALAKALDPFASFYQLEAPADGSTVDPGPIIQKALDEYGSITLGPGNWDSRTPLLCSDGQHLHLHDEDTNLWRNYSSGSATRSAFIHNRDFSKPIQGLSFTGPGNIAARQGKTGCVFGLKADNLVNDGWGTSYWTKGRHTQSVGNGHRYLNPKPWRCDPSDSSGSGGLRWGGGDDFHATGLDIWSGDDVLQVVPAGGGNDPLLNYADATNAVYEDCTGRSYSARFMVVGLQTDGTVSMTVSVRGVTFQGCHGFGGGTGVNIANHAPSTGSITDVAFADCVVDQSKAGSTGQPGDVFVLREDGTGIVDDIDFSGLTVLNPKRRSLYAKKDSTAFPIGSVKLPVAA